MGKVTRRRFLAALGSAGVLAGTYKLDDEVTGGYSESDMSLIGHRGVSGLESDNSMDGFRRAVDLGLDGVETDLRTTRDNKLVLSHDPFIVSDEDLHVISTTDYSELIKHSDLVLFSNFLDWFETQDMELYTEFKATESIDPAIQMMEERRLSENVTLMSLMPSHFEFFPDEFETAFAGSITSRIMFERLEGINPDYIIPHYLPFINSTEHVSGDQIDGYWMLSEKTEDIRDVLRTNPDMLISNRPDIVNRIIKSG